MSYIGRVEQKASDIRRFNVTGSTSATHTLTWSPPNEQSLIITINGVKQQEDAYSVSGATLTLTSALVSTDKMEVVGIQDVGETMVPGTGTITNDHISSTAAIATSKISGLATSATTDTTNASNIASGTLATARLGSGTADATTFLRGDQSWAEAGGGKVLQTVSASYATQEATSSTSYVDSSLTATITPASASNKILIWVSASWFVGFTSNPAAFARIYNSTDSAELAVSYAQSYSSGSSLYHGIICSMVAEDTGRSVATTYLLQHKSQSGGSQSSRICADNTKGWMILMEVEA